MSAAQTWFGRSIVKPRSREGRILCPTAGFVARGFDPSAAMWLGDDAIIAAADAAVASASLIPQEWLGADVLASAEALDGTLPPPPFVPEWVWNNEV